MMLLTAPPRARELLRLKNAALRIDQLGALAAKTQALARLRSREIVHLGKSSHMLECGYAD
jgi:hypothetical protein